MLLISVFQAKIYNIQRTKIIIYNQIKETFCKYLLALLVLHTLYPTSVKVFRGFLFSFFSPCWFHLHISDTVKVT